MAKKEKTTPSSDEPEPTQEQEVSPEQQEENTQKPSGGRIKRFFHAYWAKKKLSLPLTFLVLILVILAVPFTRYKVLGLVIKKNFSFVVVDDQTSRPVSEAKVSMGGRAGYTDGAGKVTLRPAVGQQKTTVTKQYYKQQAKNVSVGLSSAKNKQTIKLHATGRAVLVKVTNKINGKTLANVSISVLDTKAKTNDKGEATIVVPASQPTGKAELKADGFNDLAAEIVVTTQPTDKNNLAMIPAGKIYFLSKLSGKIDVVKTNLDGSARTTVLAGTGNEQESDTILLATRDWKYLALKSRRDSDKAKLYLIETATDKVSIMDEGNVDFTPTGWQNHSFVYQINRNYKDWQAKGQAIKSYNADSKALTTMRESDAFGTEQANFVKEALSAPYLLDDTIIYTTSWTYCCSYNNGSALDSKQNQIVEAKAGTTQATVLKAFPAKDYYNIQTSFYAPNELYFAAWANTKYEFYEYDEGKVQSVNLTDEKFFNQQYPRYVQSPSGSALFWSEARDGKNTLLVGDKNAKNGQEIASLSELTPYGWFTDNYLLVSKGNSELFILANKKGATPLKITDYHKPTFNSNGYGGGY